MVGEPTVAQEALFYKFSLGSACAGGSPAALDRPLAYDPDADHRSLHGQTRRRGAVRTSEGGVRRARMANYAPRLIPITCRGAFLPALTQQ